MAVGDAKRLLVLGGTEFVGRAIVADALSAGHRVTLFNRGRTNPELFAEAEKLRGDRERDLSALNRREWDAVIDVAAYSPDVVRLSVDALAGAVGHYVFISTVSVYADASTTAAQLEDAAVLDLASVEDPDYMYGAEKAACERVVLGALPVCSTIVRPGLIVGPHDPTDRFGYWARRMAEGGRVLAPGDPADPIQFIDVRDLAAWVLRAATKLIPGTFNLVAPPISFGELLDRCRVDGVPAELTWIDSQRLIAARFDPWEGIPLWLAEPGQEAGNLIDGSRAAAAGLRIRPLPETIVGARAQPGYDGEPSLTREAETDLLRTLQPA